MTDQEFELMTSKIIKHAPDWLKEDLRNIVDKEGDKVRISHVVSLLYNQYSFNLKHIFASMDLNYDWPETTRIRLNYIDNNLDLIELMVKKIKNKTLED